MKYFRIVVPASQLLMLVMFAPCILEAAGEKEENNIARITILHEDKRSTKKAYLNQHNLLDIYKLDLDALHQLKELNGPVEISIPIQDEEYVLLLKTVEIRTADFNLTDENGNPITSSNEYSFFKGELSGLHKGLAVMTIYNNNLKILISDEKGNLEISGRKGEYGAFRSNTRKSLSDFECHYQEKPVSTTKIPVVASNINTVNNDCVEVYLELDFQSYEDHNNSVASVESWIMSIFNEVAAVYDIENIELKLREIKVWTTPDPYRSHSSLFTILKAFGKQVKNDYNGRLAQLISTRNISGGIAWVDVLCDDYNSNGDWGPFGVCFGLTPLFQSFPSYSWNVNCIAHELGHSFGSQHTHDCVWGPSGNQQIDDCGSHFTNIFPKPSCYNGQDPKIPSVGGGTIMSYCHIGPVGINFNKGFGSEPGNLLRLRLSSASCVTGGGCGNVNSNPLVIDCPSTYYGTNNCEINAPTPNISGQATASGGQGNITINYSDNVISSSDCNFRIARTWSAVDINGKSSSCTQILILEDQENPTIINCPNNISIPVSTNCGAIVTWDDFIYRDNCDSNPSVSGTHNSGDFFEIGFTRVELFVTDNCGNLSSCSFNITVFDDNQGPSISNCPNNIIRSVSSGCTMNVSWNEPSATDPCGIQVFTSTIENGSSFNIGSTEVNYIAQDQAGNQSICSFTVTIIDELKPGFIDCPSDIELSSNGDCKAQAFWNAPVADDNCSVAGIESTHKSGDYFDLGKTTVTYTAYDDSGNMNNCNFTVNVLDACSNTLEIICPQNISLSNLCPQSNMDVGITGNADYIGGNGNVRISFTDRIILQNHCRRSIVRTWLAIDDLGFEKECEQSIAFFDNEAPEISVNSSGTYVCGNIVFDQATTFDNCSQVNLEFEDDSFIENNELVQRRIWTASDACGNQSTAKQLLYPGIDSPPVFTANNDIINYNCEISPQFVTPDVIDDCGNVSLNFEETISDQQHCAGDIIVRIWTATDEMGNWTTFTQTMTPSDNNAPEILNCPSDQKLSTEDNCFATLNFNMPSAIDDCSNAIITSSIGPGTELSVGIHEVVFYALDQCGNENQCTMMIEVVDDMAPVFMSCPENLSFFSNNACQASVSWLPPIVEDNCGYAIESNIEVGDVLPVGIHAVEYTATDPSGNESKCMFYIEVIDRCTNSIELLCPTDYTNSYDCSSTAYYPFITGSASYVGTNNTVEIQYSDSIISHNACGILIERKWTATDLVEFDSDECVQTIELIDDVAPEFTNCPSDMIINSSQSCMALGVWSTIQARDNCGLSVIVESSHSSGSYFEEGINEVIYTATDACGNVNICSFIVEVVDDIAPQFTNCPKDIFAISDENCRAFIQWEEPRVEDNCEFNLDRSHMPGSYFELGTSSVVYTATDQNGNVNTCSFIVEVVDGCTNTLQLVMPDDYIKDKSCSLNYIDTSETGVPIVINNFGSVQLLYEDLVVEDSECRYSIYREWTAIDEAGSEISEIQKIEFIDNTAPLILEALNDITVTADGNCEAIVTWEDISVFDECNAQLNIQYTPTKGSIFSAGESTVIAKVQDGCGNESSTVFSVFVESSEYPEFYCPEDIQVMADSMQLVQVSWDEPQIGDCSDISFYSSHQNGSYFGIGVTTVIYYYSYPNGDTDFCYFMINVQEQVDPCKETLYVMAEELDSGQFSASSEIRSDVFIGDSLSVNFKAGKEVLLLPGFEVELGGSFEVQIGDCEE